MAQLDIYPTLEELFSGSCEACAGMGEALRCADDGKWFVQTCPECGRNGECRMAELTGRELDAEIARVVFEYEVEKQRFWSPSPLGETLVCQADLYRYSNDGKKHTWEVVHHYSTDMNAAWQVVKKLEEHNVIVELDNWGGELCDGSWKCRMHETAIRLSSEARAETASLAICRAALKLAREETGD